MLFLQARPLSGKKDVMFKAISVLIMVAVVLAIKTPQTWPNEYRDTIDCELTTGSYYDFTNGKWMKEESDKRSQVTFADINTENPVLVGNTGSSPVRKIERGTHIYFVEFTPLGSVNVWTFFKESHSILLTKQYTLLATPFGMIQSGECQLR